MRPAWHLYLYLTHYRPIRCVLESLPCAFYRAHSKERICRMTARKHTANNKHTATMLFAVCQALAHSERGVLPCVNPQAHGEHGSRDSHADSAVRRLTAVIVCRVPESGTRQTQIFAVCHMAGTRRTWFSRHAPSGPLLFVVCPGWHTANMDLCRVPGPRHTAKIMFVVCLSPAHGEHEKKIHVFASKFFLHSSYFVWYSRFEYDIFIDILVVFN
jgi:hypothetical protein